MEIDGSRPIWIQLVDEFRRRIALGTWPPESKIPSVRELALDLGVNPNTVQRALAELDRSGITITERTSGRFVTPDDLVISQMRRGLALAATDEYIRTMAGIGLAASEIQQLIADRWTVQNRLRGPAERKSNESD